MDVFLIVILLMLSATFSASETAFSSVNRIRLKNNAGNGDKRAKRAIKILDNFDKTLTTILIGNNIVNISASAIATVMFTRNNLNVGLATFMMTVLVLIFGEITPKNLAKERPEGIALIMAGPLLALNALLTPILWVLVGLKNCIAKLFGHGKEADQPSITEEELKCIIDEIEDEGGLEEQESELVRSALEFGDITINEILIARINIAAVELTEDIEKIKETFLATHFSRLPVYDKTIDSIVGIIHEKNFFSMYFEGKSDISEIMQKPIYIFELTSISELMQEMQKTKSHMAVVIDQYGGTEGIVTMEDIIEELVGEIYDETDEEDRSFVDLGGGVYEVSGDFSVRDFAERAGLSENEIDTDCNSVGGWVMELLDHIPEQGEAVTTGRVTMTVLSTVDDQRIDRIRADVKPLEDEESKLKSDDEAEEEKQS